jgi:hypothetical protein
MNLRLSLSSLLLAALIAHARAEDAPEPKSHMMEVLRAQAAAEAAKKKPATVTPAPAAKDAKPAEKNPATFSPAIVVPAPAVVPASDAKAAAAATAATPATVLPKVEVKKPRITVLDHELAEEDQLIQREQRNSVPTEVDKALNNSKVSKALSIFGGQSGEYRANVSKERVGMMEEEKEVIEAIAHAKTKAEKDELQKELDQLRALRRDLEKSLR